MQRRTLLKAGLVSPAALTLTAAPACAGPHVGTTLATGIDTP